MTTWSMEEFAGADLGDAQLNRRLLKLPPTLADKPTASIPVACSDWAETQAVYRFFDQARDDKRGLGWQTILAPHIAQTEARMRQHPVVLCLQDTAELDFNGQGTAGLGPLSYQAQRGMYLHPTYAVTPQREPLGVTDAWMWAREPKDAKGHRPGIRESIRWTEGYERIAESARTMPETRLVYVADREADSLELMQRAQELGYPADWLIRSQHNRCLPDGGKLWGEVLAGPVLGEIEFSMPSRHGQKARMVRQQLFARPINLPDRQGGRMRATCLIAREIGAPEGSKPIEWRLLTNRPVKPVSTRGRYYKRVASSNHPLSSNEIADLYMQSLQLSWDAYPAGTHTLDDLSLPKIKRFISQVNDNGRFALESADLAALEKLNYIANGHPTWAAMLLFAKEPIRHHVHIGRFKTPDMIIDDRQFTDTLFEVVEQSMKFIISYISVAFEFDGSIRRKERFAYPLPAIREALLNAVIHRNYTDGSDIQIKIFDNQISIVSTGLLYVGNRPHCHQPLNRSSHSVTNIPEKK